MMEIGKDISQKIRSAIKAKLIELGAYVDDELPDYIMVMVANKKTKNQMTDDLSLFLSTNTDKFTTWLSGLLTKLQTLGTDKQKSQELEKSQSESLSHEPTAKKKTTPEKGDKSSTDKTVSKERHSAKVAKVSGSAVSKTNKTTKDSKKPKTEDEYVPLLLDKVETDEFSEEFKSDDTKGNKKPSVQSTPSNSQTKSTASKVSPTTKTSPSTADKAAAVTTPSVNPVVKSAVDTTYIRSVMVKPSVTKRLGSVHSRIGQVPRAMAAPVKQSTSESARQVSPMKRKQPMSVVGNVKRKFTEFEDEEEYDPYNPAVGSVASVIRVTDRKSSVPVSLQANKSLLVKAVSAAEKSVASKMQEVLREEKMYSMKESATVRPIQRSERAPPVRDTVRTGLQGGVKARTGVQKPVGRGMAGRVGKVPTMGKVSGRVQPVAAHRESHMDTVAPMMVTVSSGVKPKYNLQLASRAPIAERVLKDLRYTIANDVEKVKKEPEVAKVAPVMDSRLVQCVPAVQDRAGNDEAGEDSDLEKEDVSVNSGEDHEEVDDASKDSLLSPETPSDEGVEEESIPEGSVKDEELEGMDETDPEIQEVLDNENDDMDLILDEPEYPSHPVYVSQADKRKFIKGRSQPAAVHLIKNPKFIVTLDGVDHDKYELAMGRPDEESEMDIQEEGCLVEPAPPHPPAPPTQLMYTSTVKHRPPTDPVETPLQIPKMSPPEIKPISINLRDTDDEEEEMEAKEEEDTPLKKAKMMERCRFWPACVNGNACSYHHPTVSCKLFPQCNFGERCLYIHPNCKFDAKCTRKDCPYTHASKRGPIATVIQKIVPIPTPPPASTAYMPKMSSSASFNCKFYPNCKNMSCPFTHPTPCRFGMSCMKKSHCQFYHPALPTVDKLKWTANKSTDHISERKFDAPGAAKHMLMKTTRHQSIT